LELADLGPVALRPEQHVTGDRHHETFSEDAECGHGARDGQPRLAGVPRLTVPTREPVGGQSSSAGEASRRDEIIGPEHGWMS